MVCMTETEKPRIRVVAAVIEQDGNYLITQRMPHAVMPLLWEFPGGKVEPGETDAVALARELAEEMAIAVHVGDELLGVVKEYERFPCVPLQPAVGRHQEDWCS